MKLRTESTRLVWLAGLAAIVTSVAACGSSQGTGSPVAPSPAPPTQQTTGTLSGQVVKDLNGNGQADPGEPFLVSANTTCANSESVGGLIVNWTGAAAGSASVDQCNAEGGSFRADNLPAGSYSVTVNVPAGWTAVKAMTTALVAANNTTATSFFLQPPASPPPTPQILRSATFESANGYTTVGTADIVRSGSTHTLELRDDFRTSNGGVLDVRLCNDTRCTSGSDLNLGPIQSHSGRQTYALPNDGSNYRYVVIYCRAINAPFGFGLLR